MDAIKQRFLADRVLTATPAQRVVMLYDRLLLDLGRAAVAHDSSDAGADAHLEHATQIVAELLGSLNQQAGGPVDNLATVYGWMLRELMSAQLQPAGASQALASIEANARTLRDAWATVADEVSTAARPPVFAGAWTA